MSVTLAISVDGLTIRTVFIAGLAVFALLTTGWRKPARAEPRSPRALRRREATGFPVEHHDAPLHRRPGPLRRVLAAAAGGGIAVLTGVILAILTSFAVAAAVIWMTNLLEQ